MQETGIITELKGDMATVRVERMVIAGCGCGKMTRKEEALMEVKNLCNAGLNDRVVLNSPYDIMHYRNTIQISGAFLVFILGCAAGEGIFPQLVLSHRILFSLGLGLVLGVAAFLVIRSIYRKKTLPVPVAYDLAQVKVVDDWE